MSDSPHEVFKTKADYYDWDKYIEQCDFISELTDSQKEQAKHALRYLRKALGPAFLARAEGDGHPLIPLFMNAAAWSRVKLIGLVEAFEALEGTENFKRTLKRIRATPDKGTKPENRWQSITEQFTDGYSVLQTAYQFHKAGFKVGFVDESGSDKKPDIKLINEETSEELFVEVSVLTHPAAVANANRASAAIWDFFFSLERAELRLCAELQAAFDESHAPESLKQLHGLKDEVKASGELRELTNEFIVAAIAPANKEDQLLRWAEGKGMSPGIAGPPLFLNELSRAMRKIRGKFPQLPPDKPGIIAVPTPQSFLFHLQQPEEIIRAIEAQLQEYPNVFGVILSQGHLDKFFGESVASNIGLHTVVNKTMADTIKQPVVVVGNPAFAITVSEATLTKLQKAFNEL